MRLLASVAVLLVCLAGCRDSNSSGVTAGELKQALRGEGFDVAVAHGRDKEKFRRVFAQDTGDVEDVVTQHSVHGSFRPTGPSAVGDLVVVGLVYPREAHARCSRSNVIGVCLHRRNVVIVVRDERASAARRALAKLG